MCYQRRLFQVQYLAVTLTTQWQQAHSCTPTYMEFRAERLVCPILTDGTPLIPFTDDWNKAIIRTECRSHRILYFNHKPKCNCNVRHRNI